MRTDNAITMVGRLQVELDDAEEVDAKLRLQAANSPSTSDKRFILGQQLENAAYIHSLKTVIITVQLRYLVK